MRVLIADDNPDAADSLARLLELWGYEAQVAYNTAAALQRALDFRPEVVVLDMKLRTMLPGDLALTLRAQHGRKIRIVGTGDGDLQHMSLLGMYDDFFLKPCNLDKLKTLLADYGRSP